jgi:hypothetical protein
MRKNKGKMDRNKGKNYEKKGIWFQTNIPTPGKNIIQRSEI